MKFAGYIYACVFLIAVLLFGFWWVSDVTVPQVEVLLAKEMPVGASTKQITSFLDAHGMTYWEPKDIPQPFLDRPERSTDFSNHKLDGKRVRIKREMIAKVPGIRDRFLVERSIFIHFYLDEDNRLVEYLVTELGLGF